MGELGSGNLSGRQEPVGADGVSGVACQLVAWRAYHVPGFPIESEDILVHFPHSSVELSNVWRVAIIYRMAKEPQRIIECALFEGEIGPISAAELMGMPEDRWGMLRQIITDARRGKPPRDEARCLMCGGPVFIKTRVFGSRRLPLFAHYQGGDENCPWFNGRTKDPADVRAAQYQGNQESIPHRMLCNRIAELAAADERHVRAAVDKYLPPTENEHGRYPDVHIEWNGFPPFVIELQLSRTFQTEISDRGHHYAREGIPLIWVLYGLDLMAGDLPQSFRDVIIRHRNNAFTISSNSIRESVRQRTLVLGCHLKALDGQFEAERLVRLDELTFPKKGLPYFDDRVAPGLLADAEKIRRPWWSELKQRAPANETACFHRELNHLFDDLCQHIPELHLWFERDIEHKGHLIQAVAVVFSVITYARGEFVNLVTRQPNVVGMLNSKLISRGFAPFAHVTEVLLKRTAAHDLLEGSVRTHLERAHKSATVQVSERDLVWKVLAKLVPEVFDPVCRRELAELGALPRWASQDGKAMARNM